MFAGTYSTSAASASAAGTSSPPQPRLRRTSPQRMHSATAPGSSSSTRWVRPQESQEIVASAAIVCFDLRTCSIVRPPIDVGDSMIRTLALVAVLLLGGCGYNTLQSQDE